MKKLIDILARFSGGRFADAVSAYNVGRSMEKSGKHNVFTQAVTGEKTKPKTD